MCSFLIFVLLPAYLIQELYCLIRLASLSFFLVCHLELTNRMLSLNQGVDSPWLCKVTVHQSPQHFNNYCSLTFLVVVLSCGILVVGAIWVFPCKSQCIVKQSKFMKTVFLLLITTKLPWVSRLETDGTWSRWTNNKGSEIQMWQWWFQFHFILSQQCWQDTLDLQQCKSKIEILEKLL